MDLETQASSIIARVDGWLATLEGLARDNAAEGWNALLMVFQIEAISDLGKAGIGFLFTSIYLVFALCWYKKAVKMEYRCDHNERVEGDYRSRYELLYALAFVGGGIAACFWVLCLFLLGNASWWVDAFNPEVALVRSLIQ